MTMYIIAFDPSFVIELKTNEKITKGKENINNSFIDKLIAYKKDFISKGITEQKNKEKSRAPRKTRGIAKFLIVESTDNYLLENWNLLRAFLHPYFFLSTTLESLVKNPPCFNDV